jgi:hypothetical protein
MSLHALSPALRLRAQAPWLALALAQVLALASRLAQAQELSRNHTLAQAPRSSLELASASSLAGLHT